MASIFRFCSSPDNELCAPLPSHTTHQTPYLQPSPTTHNIIPNLPTQGDQHQHHNHRRQRKKGCCVLAGLHWFLSPPWFGVVLLFPTILCSTLSVLLTLPVLRSTPWAYQAMLKSNDKTPMIKGTTKRYKCPFFSPKVLISQIFCFVKRLFFTGFWGEINLYEKSSILE